MNYELTIYELGQALTALEKAYGLDVVIRLNLSGGWMTLIGKATIERSPAIVALNGNPMRNNTIEFKVIDNNNQGTIIKLTGDKSKKFNVNVDAAKYRELGPKSTSPDEIKVNENECKLIIDDNIIFSIKTPVSTALKLIKSKTNLS